MFSGASDSGALAPLGHEGEASHILRIELAGQPGGTGLEGGDALVPLGCLLTSPLGSVSDDQPMALPGALGHDMKAVGRRRTATLSLSRA